MSETDPIAELLAGVAKEHLWVDQPNRTCTCGWTATAHWMVDRSQPNRVEQHLAHLGETQAVALRATGHVVDGTEVEWAVVDRGRTIHIEGATCPADVLAGAHGHGATQVGVACRTVIRTPWHPINHGQENP